MTSSPLLLALASAGAAAVVAGVVIPSGSWPARRLRRAVPVRSAPRTPAGRTRTADRLCRWAPWLAAVACYALLGGPIGALVGGLACAALRRWLPRLVQRPRRQPPPSMPLCLDLLANGLRAGASVGGVVDAVAAVLGDEAGEAMQTVSGRLRLGMPPDDAWGAPGWGHPWPEVVRDVVRASDAGTALATTLTRHAGTLRAARRSAAEAAVRRAAVLSVLPVGLCFLPAFVLLAVVPVAGGLIGGVLG